MAILLGMILGGAVIASSQGNLMWISLTGLTIAVLGYISSRFILKQNVTAPDLKINWNFFRTSYQTMKYAKSLPLIFTILLGELVVLVLWCYLPHSNSTNDTSKTYMPLKMS